MRGSTLIAVNAHDLFLSFLIANVKRFRTPLRIICLTAKGKLSEKPIAALLVFTFLL